MAGVIQRPSHSRCLLHRGFIYLKGIPALGVKLLLCESEIVRIRFVVGQPRADGARR